MLLKKKFTQSAVNGVQMGNGIVSFRGIKMNVYCYYVDGVLIDTGARTLERELRPFFHQFDMDQVVITHFHEDHTGCAAWLQKEYQLPIYMNEQMIDYCRRKADYPLYRQLFWGRRLPFDAQPLHDSFTSRNATWKVIHTPGHAVDHLAFLNEGRGQLFTGDLYCQTRTKVILREESIPTIIQSLKKILTYDFDDVFCQHAGYLKKGRTALERKLEYLQNMEEKVWELYQEGKSPKQINTILFPKKYPITRFSLGEWNSMHIIHSILKDNRDR